MLSKLITLCGILGIWARNKKGEDQFDHLPNALATLSHRGPDHQHYKIYSGFALAHARLSVIDLSDNANQPFSDETGNYQLIFNGEIYNYLDLKKRLVARGHQFRTNSDTEVLLKILIDKGADALSELNGFFSFIFVDLKQATVLAARDRIGIKPLLFSIDADKLILASELKSFLKFDIDRSIDEDALQQYFSYTYIPAPRTILASVKKVMPGQYLKFENGELTFKTYYKLEKKPTYSGDFFEAKKDLVRLLESSVEKRLVADVPVGSFLSGGLDSSVIASIAKKQKDDLHTFSIGFDHPYFNESDYAEEVAKHLGTKHHTLVLDKKSFKTEFESFLNSLDEPFADSSAFAVYLLSERTKKSVTVSLSGDGADELFAGYRKHQAELRTRETGLFKRALIKGGSKLMGSGAETRSSKSGDFRRRLHKFAGGLNLSGDERYHLWCRWIDEADTQALLKKKGQLFQWHSSLQDLNDFLLRDQEFVLPNDMLKKVDQMSMAHALEVRVPFLDHRVVEFANSLPEAWKATAKKTKIILRETFRTDLPESILNRSKKGFEIPLQSWLNEEIDACFNAVYFSSDYLKQQNIFEIEFIEGLKKELKSGRIGERIYLIWALIVFQNWYHQTIRP